MNFLKKEALFLAVIVLLGAFLGGPAAVQGETPLKVALVPLQINAPDKLDYLRNGLQDIMASRLAWEGKVIVLDQEPVRKALAKFPGLVDDTRSREIGESLGVDVVVFGSLTMIGTGASLDIRVKELAKKQAAEKFYTETKNLDEVIPRVNDLLEDINAKIFERPRTAVAAPEGRGIPGVGTVASGPGERTGLSLKDFTLRPLSPQIIMNAGGFDLSGIWKSSILPYALVDMAFGDLDGDGNIETVIISQKKVHVYRFKDDKFNLLTEVEGHRNDNYISVDVADINGTGRPQIFVTNFRNDGIRSLVLGWEGAGLKTIAKDVPYSWRVHQIPGRGELLLGQQRRGKYSFGSKIKVLSWKDGGYAPVEELPLPDEINVFNFKVLDLNGDGIARTIYINQNNRLVLLSAQGTVEYQSPEYYGGSITYVDVSESTGLNLATTTTMSERAARTYLPTRLVVIPGIKSPKPELVLTKNKDSLWNILDRFTSYSSGVIHSLSWDGVTFKEDWRTMTINDYVANYGIDDFKNIKQKQLVVGVVQFRGLPLVGNLIGGARSVIYCYDLGVVKFEKK